MQEIRKKIIQRALDFDIANIYTYSGYKGDLIVKITSTERQTIIALRQFALSLGIKEVVIKQNHDMKLYEIYCVTEDEGTYHLKHEHFMKEIHENHPVKDVWEKGIVDKQK